jgi:NADH-quinone oxidoreductase subunit N
MMNLNDFAALSPLLILLGGALLILLLESFKEEASKKHSFYLTLFVLLIGLSAALYAPVSQNPLLTPWLKFDQLAQLFTVFFLIIGLSVTLLSSPFFYHFEAPRGEYYFLLLAALFGLILIGSAADFLTLFLGIETLSIALYILCGYMKNWEFSSESSMKYFLMGSLAAATLLYGIALVYGATGTTRLEALSDIFKTLGGVEKNLFLSGIALVTIALAFEAAVVPFHFWAPDVYDGAPTPVTAFMAVGTKVGAFAAFIRVFMEALPHFDPIWIHGITLLVYATLIYANFVAIRQTEMRRFFAYSGISHAGFLLIPLAVGTPEALSALIFYLIIYAIATLGSFAVLSFLDERREGVSFKQLKGLFKRSSLLAAIFILCLLTLAGIPPTVGFFAKFYLFKVAYQAHFYTLVIVALLTTILSAFYYLRIVALMLADAPEDNTIPTRYWPASFLAVTALALILLFSWFPALISAVSG